MGTQLPLPKKGGSPQFLAHAYCGQTAGWIKMALVVQVGRSPSHIVLDGDQAPFPKRGQSPPIFGPGLLWPNGQIYQGSTRRQASARGDFVLDGDPAPLPKKGWSPPQFLAHVYCGQTAGRIKMALGMEVGLGPGNIVLDMDQAPFPQKRGLPPNCRHMSIVDK